MGEESPAAADDVPPITLARLLRYGGVGMKDRDRNRLCAVPLLKFMDWKEDKRAIAVLDADDIRGYWGGRGTTQQKG